MGISKVVQMLTRGFIVLLMAVGFLLNSESEFMNATSAFLASGVFGSCFIVSVAVMIEAGLQIYPSDDFIECSFCVVGILLNIMMTSSAFHEYTQSYGSQEYAFKSQHINKGVIGIIAVMVYLVDIVLVFF